MAAITDLDLGPLSWVKGEIDLALGRAHETLDKFGANPDDSAQLKFAGTHLHQAQGALSIVGLDGVAQVVDMIEQLLSDAGSGSVATTPAVGELAQKAITAVRDYLDEVAKGLPNQTLKLLPVYRDLQAARGVERVAPGDLFFPDLSLHPPKRTDEPPPLSADKIAKRLKTERARFERGFLRWLRDVDDVSGVVEMREAVAAIEATQALPSARAFWWVSVALLDALAERQVPVDFQIKKLCARIDLQMRRLLEGAQPVAERLMRDALYFVAVAEGGQGVSARVRQVREAYQLDALVPGNLDIEPLKPVLLAMRNALAAAKKSLNEFCAGAAAALPQFHKDVVALESKGGGLINADLARLIGGIVEIAKWLRKDPLRENDATAMEVATALLLTENAIENYARLGADFPQQVDAVLNRFTAMMHGEDLTQLSAPLLDEITRRAQESLMMGQVAREILANLSRIEQALDAFFRDTRRRDELSALDGPLKQIEGALVILNQDRAVAVLRECEARIQAFAKPDAALRREDFEQVADKLSALGFFVEALQYGPADLDEILKPAQPKTPPAEEGAPATPSIEEGLERQKRELPDLVRALRDQPQDEGVRERLKQHLDTLRQDASLVADAELEEAAQAALTALAEAPLARIEETIARIAPEKAMKAAEEAASPAEESIDAELLAIFFEEAHEVLDTIAKHLELSRAAPHDRNLLTPVNRGFHTLKGSGRMVGLADLGETAWAVEQVMNKWRQSEQDPSPSLYRLIEKAHALFVDWVKQLEAGGGTPAGAAALAALAERVKAGEDITQDAETAATEDAEAVAEETAAPASVAPAADDTVALGDFVISRTLYDLYLGEARTYLSALRQNLNTLKLTLRMPPEEMVRAAHTLAGISGTVGIMPAHHLALALEHTLLRMARSGQACNSGQIGLLGTVVSTLDAMVAAVAEQRIPHDADGLAAELDEMTRATPPAAVELSVVPAPEPSAGNASGATAAEAPPEPESAPVEKTPLAPLAPPVEETPVVDPAGTEGRPHPKDDLNAELLPVFVEEATDLAREIGVELRHWHADPQDEKAPAALARLLHTLKGSARMAGAASMGELVHGIETRLGEALTAKAVTPQFFDEFDAAFDRVNLLLDDLGQRAVAAETSAPEAITAAQAAIQPAAVRPEQAARTWESGKEEGESGTAAAHAMLRVRADLVDRLVNEAGEISIARSRIEGEMRTLRGSLLDLTESVIRLRSQLREIEIQAESQMQSRMAQAQESAAGFDPLELDRFTRFQEITRMMAESVNDVTTAQHGLLRNLDHTDSAIGGQARLNRDLSQSLLSVRMVPFNTVVDRLYRVVRLTAKEMDKQARLDIQGGEIELDRSVLEKMTGPLEHLLRNAVTHGLESGARRQAAGKPAVGEISLTVSQEGNEVVIEMADDGAGLDLARIQAKAVERGLLAPGQPADEAALTEFIFLPGFSTAEKLSETAGRGVGMGVVKTETAQLGGRTEVASTPGQGTRFRIYLPLTLAVMQGLLVRVNGRTYAIPSVMVEQVMELDDAAVEKIRAEGAIEWLDQRYPCHLLSRLLGDPAAPRSLPLPLPQRRQPFLLLRAAAQRVAIQIDELRGNQELVVKNIGPQLARVAGITSATVLGDGEIALILNPIVLAGRATGSYAAEAAIEAAAPATPAPAHLPTVMVVDDSLTVRKITGRLLAREGYHVLTAKDGLDAIDQLADVVPDVMLVDIEMPRMDGFELTRNVRADARLENVPIIMITSRMAEKHRSYAKEIGVNHYLGKPYQEEELLSLVAGYTRQTANAG
ncbi:MAG: Hpt domain-containing protein [Zoogloeaceae bacterium]|jgi:chemosensory pili system protein ChpA (sensor histidine kinase/response regulator)|nr:Hpt domain-containing protein [Zoogloeaceae bacterium]